VSSVLRGRGLIVILAVIILTVGALFLINPARALNNQNKAGKLLALAMHSKSEMIACEIPLVIDKSDSDHVQEVVKLLELAIKYAPSNSQSYLQLGRAYCLLDQPDKAIEAFKTYIQLRPDNPLGHLELGFVFDCLGMKEQAVLKWQEAGMSWYDFYEAGEQANLDKQYSQAIHWFQRATWLNPNVGDPYYAAGMSYQSQGDLDQAISSYKAALMADLLQAVQPGDVYYKLGLVYQADSEFRNLDMALEMYHNVLKPEMYSTSEIQSEAHYKIGEIYLWQGLNEFEAIVEFRRALILNPSHRWAHLRLGHALYGAYKDVDQAQAEISQAANLWPDDASKKIPYRTLGDIYLEAGNSNQAIQAYQQALKYDPVDKEIIEKLAKLLER
jgi:tetratricopeptide (TPR) repeat protein